MEKFGVDVVSPPEKSAGDKEETAARCPLCGTELLSWKDSNVPRCPACGTKGFEAK